MLTTVRFAWVVIIAAEILAVAQLWTFKFDPLYLASIGYPDATLSWPVGQNSSPAIWVAIFLIAIGLANLLPVKWYGRLEYSFGCVKMVFIVGLILFNTVLNARKLVPNPSGTQTRFWTYNEPYSFIAENYTLGADTTGKGNEIVLTDSLGQFAGVWSAMTTIVFSLIGFDTTASERPRPGPQRALVFVSRTNRVGKK